jgi:benzoyl-CoA reductase/2-hydroxyglutaryl-CoA dehydratase subunit BcrC/BadD/HgdB
MTFASSCIHINRVGHNFKILNLDKEKENFVHHVFDFPVKVSSSSVEGAIKSLKVLAEKISASYDIDMGDEAVNKAIHDFNEFNKILKEISDLRKADNPKITGTEWHTVCVACKVAPKDMLVEPLKKLKKALDKREGISADMPRVMILGSIFDNPQFTDLIEGQGCLVVADRHCFGSLPGLELIPETGDPYRNLAVHYLETAECPRMMGKENDRVAHVMQWIEEYRVDGIIMEVMKFCDLWAYDAVYNQRAFMSRDIPIVKIEREYNLTGEGQLRTRVQAFIESIVNKRMTEKLG